MIRLAWCGPWNGRSAIAAFGQLIVSELLARRYDVTVFRSETGEALNEEPLPTSARVESLLATDIDTLRQSFDGIIANVGDNYPFHGSIVGLLERCPCLAIFHDGLIANLAAAWAYQAAGGEKSLRALVQQLYGDSVWEEGTPYWNWSRIEIPASVRPMTEWLAPLAGGIVTHSEFWASRMRAACSGKVDVLPLAFPDFKVPAPREHGEKLIVATVGHINPNKRADQVLLAIANDPVLRSRCEYRLLGPIADAERGRLERLSGDLGISAPRFSGWLSDEAMRAEIAEVNVISCLRDPVIEAGSASLVTAMYAARPTLVSWHGLYAEVPNDTVLGCKPGQEAADIATHLRAILADPSTALSVGHRARAHALQYHSPAYYVDRLLPAAAGATAAAPAIGTASRLGKLLGHLGVDSNDPAASRIAQNLSEMLADRHRN